MSCDSGDLTKDLSRTWVVILPLPSKDDVKYQPTQPLMRKNWFLLSSRFCRGGSRTSGRIQPSQREPACNPKPEHAQEHPCPGTCRSLCTRYLFYPGHVRWHCTEHTLVCCKR